MLKLRRETPKPVEATPSTQPSPPTAAHPASTVKEKFDGFLSSLGDTLLDITALEVNTMVVSNISGTKFNPIEAYYEMYIIPHPNDDDKLTYFTEREIPAEVHDRYIKLRQKLGSEFRQIIGKLDAGSQFPDLPDPSSQPGTPEFKGLQFLLSQPQFLRALRKIYELKSALDSDSAQMPIVDLIYAQTVIQLDGDVINRYHEKLFTHAHRDKIIEIHNAGVTCGEKQWHGLLDFMVNLIQNIITGRSMNGTGFNQNGQK